MIPTDRITDSPYWADWGGSRARHCGLLNVLFEDGRVEQMLPATINPMVPELNDTYWRPVGDPELVR